MASLPFTQTYWFADPAYRTGLTPAFVSLVRTDTMASVSQPTITELGFGIYVFTRTFLTLTQPDWAWLINTNATSGNPTAGLVDTSAVEGGSSVEDIPPSVSAQTFPINKPYVVSFNLGKTGLSPTFIALKQLPTGISMPKPTIREIGYGQYQFVWPFQTPTDLDLVYVISGSGLGFADLSTIAVGGISVNDAIQPPVQTYPWTRYYFFTDPQLRTGLTPQFISAYRTDVLEPVTDMGAIVEVGNGVYKTSRVISNATSPDYAWVINTSGTALNPTAGLSDITLVEGFSSTVDVPGQTSEAFPATKVYVVGFNLEATGLTPTFTMLKRLDTLANESQPAITELNRGRYYFPWTFAAETDPESVYLISAGVGPSLKNIGGIAVNDVLTPIITPFQPSIVEAVLPPSAIASLGIDIDARGDLQFPMVLVGGFANLGQALTHRLMTPRGGLFYASDYGTDVRAYLNSSITQGQLVALAKKISKECEKDERVASCITTLTYNALNATMRITLVIQTAAGTYQYILGVNQISVAILQGQPIQQLAA